jgi:hypothetical protein
VKRADRRRMSSRSSVGRVAGVFAEGLDFDVVLVVGAARSRWLRALRRRWAFAARIRAILRDCDLVRRDKSAGVEVALLSRLPAPFVRGGSWLSRLGLGCCLPVWHEELRI